MVKKIKRHFIEVVLERKYLFHYTGIAFLIFVVGLFILFVGAVYLVLRYPELRWLHYGYFVLISVTTVFLSFKIDKKPG